MLSNASCLESFINNSFVIFILFSSSKLASHDTDLIFPHHSSCVNWSSYSCCHSFSTRKELFSHSSNQLTGNPVLLSLISALDPAGLSSILLSINTSNVFLAISEFGLNIELITIKSPFSSKYFLIF
jgi:hypothetical protein